MNAPHPPLSPLAPERQSPTRRNLVPCLSDTSMISLPGPVGTMTLALGTTLGNGGSLPVLEMVTWKLNVRRRRPLYKNISMARMMSRTQYTKKGRGELMTMVIIDRR
jgi:hypothetical protein